MATRAKLVGFNHVALEVGDLEEALEQVVEYSDVQFTKAPEVLRGMDLDHLKKSEKALEELRKKGLAPE